MLPLLLCLGLGGFIAPLAAARGYLGLSHDESNSERIQSRHAIVRVARMNPSLMAYCVDPMLFGSLPTAFVAGNDSAARTAVAGLGIDTGLDPWDVGPLRFAQLFDSMDTMAPVPKQQDRVEGSEWRLMPSAPPVALADVSQSFGCGRPNDLGRVHPLPWRDLPVACDGW
jgi:hypothetical protein